MTTFYIVLKSNGERTVGAKFEAEDGREAYARATWVAALLNEVEQLSAWQVVEFSERKRKGVHYVG